MAKIALRTITDVIDATTDVVTPVNDRPAELIAYLDHDAYPDPDATIGEAILAGTPRPPGRVVGMHLGVGLADLVFGDAIVREARRRRLGTPLPR